jgi:hypothetical protein
MVSRRSQGRRELRWLGIGLLVLSMMHTPLPKADYHNIRHHDQPGEFCPYHDHLLLWHPDADRAADVAVLHWHWVLPLPGGPDPSAPRDGPSVHGRVPDWSGLTWDEGPSLAPDTQGRFLSRAEPGATAVTSLPLASAPIAGLTRAGPRSIHAFGATFAPRIARASLLQRWNC